MSEDLDYWLIKYLTKKLSVRITTNTRDASASKKREKNHHAQVHQWGRETLLTMYLYFYLPFIKQEQQQCFVALHCVVVVVGGENCNSCVLCFISVHCCCCCCQCGSEEVSGAWEPRSQNHKSEKRLSSPLMYLSMMIFLSFSFFLSFACNREVFNYCIGDKYMPQWRLLQWWSGPDG